MIMISPAMAELKPYSIDGDLSDWGVTMGDLQKGLNNDDKSSWIPDCSTCQDVDWIVENDLDSAYTCTWNAATGGYDFCYKGVHITGTGQTYSDYNEPRLKDKRNGNLVPQPSGGEPWDIEALYFDDDDHYIYFGIVTSDVDQYIGDLSLNVNGVNYGIVLKDHDGLQRGDVYRNPSWLVSSWAEKEDGSEIKTRIDPNNHGTKVGKAVMAIGGPAIGVPSDNGINNYIIEIRVNKTDIGSPPANIQGDISYALTCGNDYIEKKVTYNYETIPEFYAILLPAGIIVGFFYYHRNRNR